MSDKKNKDNRKEDTKSKKNMKKTQEMPVSTELKTFPHSCTDCGVLNCSKRNASYPEFCLTEKLTEKEYNAQTTASYIVNDFIQITK